MGKTDTTHSIMNGYISTDRCGGEAVRHEREVERQGEESVKHEEEVGRHDETAMPLGFYVVGHGNPHRPLERRQRRIGI